MGAEQECKPDLSGAAIQWPSPTRGQEAPAVSQWPWVQRRAFHRRGKGCASVFLGRTRGGRRRGSPVSGIETEVLVGMGAVRPTVTSEGLGSLEREHLEDSRTFAIASLQLLNCPSRRHFQRAQYRLGKFYSAPEVQILKDNCKYLEGADHTPGPIVNTFYVHPHSNFLRQVLLFIILTL